MPPSSQVVISKSVTPAFSGKTASRKTLCSPDVNVLSQSPSKLTSPSSTSAGRSHCDSRFSVAPMLTTSGSYLITTLNRPTPKASLIFSMTSVGELLTRSVISFGRKSVALVEGVTGRVGVPVPGTTVRVGVGVPVPGIAVGASSGSAVKRSVTRRRSTSPGSCTQYSTRNVPGYVWISTFSSHEGYS